MLSIATTDLSFGRTANRNYCSDRRVLHGTRTVGVDSYPLASHQLILIKLFSQMSPTARFQLSTEMKLKLIIQRMTALKIFVKALGLHGKKVLLCPVSI